VFLAHAGTSPPKAPEDAAALEALLEGACAIGRNAWPGVALPAEVFVRHLAERLSAGEGGTVAESLAQLCLADLYLACACAHGAPGAIAAFERSCLAKLPGMLAYLRQPAAAVEDVGQMMRMQLLVRTGEGPARIAEYAGRGSLLGWMRVIAVRALLKLVGAARETPSDDAATAFQALPARGVDAELDLLKRRHQEELKQAVREAFSALSNDERHLLRLYFLEQLNTVELAALFGVNQSTISRWIKSARQTVYEAARRRLQDRMGLSGAEFESFLGALQSRLDVSISRIFGEEGEAEEGDEAADDVAKR